MIPRRPWRTVMVLVFIKSLAREDGSHQVTRVIVVPHTLDEFTSPLGMVMMYV